LKPPAERRQAVPELTQSRSGTAFLRHCLDHLEELGPILPRAMFGGFGLYCHGIFFGIVHQGRLYFKTSDASQARYRAQGSRPFRPSHRQTLWSYYEVPADVTEDAETLCAWADEAIAIQRSRLGVTRRL
jgi:DNA transformation protein and related proteins